ncbi:MAG: galactose-1-phosphate uridylyltransferase [Candidatus Bipolaricaulota bacterium]
MIQIRKSIPKDRWAIIAPTRGDRPFDFSHDLEEESHPEDCPFCEGNEEETPPEVFAVRDEGKPNGTGWKVRVFPNKYPALDDEEAPYRIEGDLFETIGGFGSHEVLVESPDHEAHLEEIPPERIEMVLEGYLARYRSLISVPDIEYVSIFKNRGKRAGASLSHPHSQIMATPFVPELQTRELDNTRNFFAERGECFYCNLLESETSERTRIVLENEGFVVLSPYAASAPFELHIIPKTHRGNFEKITGDEKTILARTMKSTLTAMTNELGDFPYNYFIHTAPPPQDNGDHPEDYYHWHLEIIPRLTNPAGFEWAGGNFINVVQPEDAAGRIRHALP